MIYRFLIYAFFIVCKIASEEKIKYSEDFAPVSIEELSFKAGLQKESLHMVWDNQFAWYFGDSEKFGASLDYTK